MLDKNQKTLIKSASFEGVGLHSGVKVKVNLVPAKDNTGILFKRVDLKDNNIIKANYKAVSSAKLCTTLENENKTKVSTVEHLMAAFYITGIDNIIVEIDNSEVPIMDGSSKEFIELILSSKNSTLIGDLQEGAKMSTIDPLTEKSPNLSMNSLLLYSKFSSLRIRLSLFKLFLLISIRIFFLFIPSSKGR